MRGRPSERVEREGERERVERERPIEMVEKERESGRWKGKGRGRRR